MRKANNEAHNFDNDPENILMNSYHNSETSKLSIYKHNTFHSKYPGCSTEKSINGFDIIKAESFRGINSIIPDWQKLIHRLNISNIYITPDFYTRLFDSRAHNAKPNVILFKKDNEPQAMLVGWLTETSIDCKLGYLKTKTPKLKTFEIEIGGIIANETTDAEEVLEKYMRNIIENKKVELISIDHLSATNKCWEKIKEGIVFHRKAIYRNSVKWKAKIYDSKTGEIIHSYSKKTEQKFRKKDRKLQKYFDNNVEIKTITSPNDIGYFIESAAAIDKHSYHKALGISVEEDEYYHDMFFAMAEGGYFRGYLLFAGKEPIAYYYGALYDGMFYAFNTSYNNNYRMLSPGIFLLRRMMELFVKENINVIHFGYGDSPYKRMFGTEAVEEATFRIYGSGIKPALAKLLDKATLTTTDKLTEFLDRLHILNKIKKAWRNKLLHKKAANY